jgi:hypothetical protein
MGCLWRVKDDAIKGPLDARTRKLTVIAQDPTIKSGGRILTTQLDVPDEPLLPGPCGYRVHVIDYDASTGVHYKPRDKGLVIRDEAGQEQPPSPVWLEQMTSVRSSPWSVAVHARRTTKPIGCGG